MLNVHKLWLGIGVITLVLTHNACASNTEGAQRLIKEPFWMAAGDETLSGSDWDDYPSSKAAILQPSEADGYTADSDKLTAETSGMMIGHTPVVDLARSSSGEEGNSFHDDRLRSLLKEFLFLSNGNSRSRGLGSGPAGPLWRPAENKRGPPLGFHGSRGKRFIPGLESLLLAKYYRDAAKFKRQPHSGFHGSRG